MVYRSSRSLTVEERRREEVWLAAIREAGEITRSRYNEMAHLLGLGKSATRAFENAALEAARYYHELCTYANYARRAGHPYPVESHAHDEHRAEQTWTAELDQFRESVRTQ